MTRRKPVGWRGQSYHHYLAAKGIKTKRYFVRNELKGNRGGSALHSLWAQGYSNAEIEGVFGIPVPKRKRETVFNVPDRDEAFGPRAAVGDPLVEPPSPVTQEEETQQAMPDFAQAEPQSQPVAAQVAEAQLADESAQEQVAGDEDFDSSGTEVTVTTPGIPKQSDSFDILDGGES